jgi:hypothetical protein
VNKSGTGARRCGSVVVLAITALTYGVTSCDTFPPTGEVAFVNHTLENVNGNLVSLTPHLITLVDPDVSTGREDAGTDAGRGSEEGGAPASGADANADPPPLVTAAGCSCTTGNRPRPPASTLAAIGGLVLAYASRRGRTRRLGSRAARVLRRS